MNIGRFLRKLRWLSERRRKDADLRDELAFHLDTEADARREAGVPESSARLAARRDLGNLTLITEDTRAVWGWPLLEQIWQDLRYAVRALRRLGGSSAAAAMTLALGIGVTTAIFTVVHGVILRPLPFHEPDRLMSLNTVVGPSLRQHVAALDANLPVTEMRTLEGVVADARARPRSFTVLLSLLSALALTLAAVGIFGLLSFAVAQRTKEIGVRIALGASPRALVGTIVREAMTLVLLGAAIGTAAAMLLARLVATQLYETSPIDPLAFAAVALVLGLTACLASLVPAWRATSVDPLIALRSD